MNQQFLKYSLEKQRKIRVVWMEEADILQKNAIILSVTDVSVTLQITTKKSPITIPLSAILSCDYARGDHGEAD